MKKLKVYKKCDFRLIEMCSAHEILANSKNQIGVNPNQPGSGGSSDETGEFDAGAQRNNIFPNGDAIWDN